MYLTLAERLQKVNDKTTDEERLTELNKHLKEYPKYKDFLYLAYAPFVEFNLPEGDPPFKLSDVPVEYAGSNILKEHRRIGYFIKGNPTGDTLKPLKRETMFIQCLEAMNALEAKLLLDIKNKRMEEVYPNITMSFMMQHFPEFFIVREQEETASP